MDYCFPTAADYAASAAEDAKRKNRDLEKRIEKLESTVRALELHLGFRKQKKSFPFK